VEQGTLPLLSAWESFYVIVGSSAAALTGLQFVVIVLGAEMNALTSDRAARAFGTPTVVHFCAVLLISAILSAPWHGLSSAGIILAACGTCGLAYAAMVVRHARRQTDYAPVLEDWIWHIVLPLVAYAGLLAAAVLLQQHPEQALFGVGANAILLLFIGIHNAWDSVVYMALQRPQEPPGR
jgi:hypothetical protein